MRRVIMIAAWELRQMARDGRMRIALVATLAMFAVAFAIGLRQQQRYEEDVRSAAAADHHIWGRQGERSPHAVAHFGRYAFKPAGPLSAFDPGMTPWLGTALWMEAHYQNTASFRAIEDQALPAIIATLSPAFVLQHLAPLLLIFLGYALIARERERHTLKVALANGGSLRSLVGGKTLALTMVAAVLTAPAVIPVWLADNADARLRAALLAATYAGFLTLICLLIVAVSALARTARTALIALLCGWAVMALVIPRIGSLLAEQLAPSMDAAQFWRDVRGAMNHGLDGGETPEARDRALLERTLAQYAVAREEDLPISFAGVLLQADEEHGNAIFDHFYGRLQTGLDRQRTVLRTAGVLSPWMATADLSMGLAGTDAFHHWRYAQAAERYRRSLQRYLNDVMTYQGKGEGFDYQADQTTWRRAPLFSYAAPTLRDAGTSFAADLWFLLGWALLALASLQYATARLERAGALA